MKITTHNDTDVLVYEGYANGLSSQANTVSIGIRNPRIKGATQFAVLDRVELEALIAAAREALK